jgi:hypothetical protein
LLSGNPAARICRARQNDLEPVRGALGKILGRKIFKLFLSCDKLYAGTVADWPEVNTSRGGVLSIDARGTNYTIMVAQIDALPGLVLYWNFDLPVAALKLLYDTLRDAFNRFSNRIRRWVIEVYTWVVAIALATVAVLLLLESLVAGAIEALVAALARLGPVLEPVLAGIRAFASALTGAAAGWTLALPATDRRAV